MSPTISSGIVGSYLQGRSDRSRFRWSGRFIVRGLRSRLHYLPIKCVWDGESIKNFSLTQRLPKPFSACKITKYTVASIIPVLATLSTYNSLVENVRYIVGEKNRPDYIWLNGIVGIIRERGLWWCMLFSISIWLPHSS